MQYILQTEIDDHDLHPDRPSLVCLTLTSNLANPSNRSKKQTNKTKQNPKEKKNQKQ